MPSAVRLQRGSQAGLWRCVRRRPPLGVLCTRRLDVGENRRHRGCWVHQLLGMVRHPARNSFWRIWWGRHTSEGWGTCSFSPWYCETLIYSRGYAVPKIPFTTCDVSMLAARVPPAYIFIVDSSIEGQEIELSVLRWDRCHLLRSNHNTTEGKASATLLTTTVLQWCTRHAFCYISL